MFHLDNKSGIPTRPEIPETLSEQVLWFTEGKDKNEPSYPGAHWFNIVQAELLNVLKEAGIEPEKQSLDQLAQSLRVLSGQVESIEALRAFEPVRDRQVAYVKGYHLSTTTGGGFFIADLNDNQSADNGGTVIITAGGKRWKRVVLNNIVTVEDFGAVGDGQQDSWLAIQNALHVCAYRYELRANKGTYLISQELKMPSGTTFTGAGMYETEIKVTASLGPTANAITNASNNYQVRETFDKDIHLSNMTVNAEWRGRYSIGQPLNNQGCGVKFSAVRHSSIINVRAINAPLHCFDIAADQYLDDGNVTSNRINQSEHIYIRGCVAENPYRDDGFTTHNSRYIVFENCLAVFDGTVSTLGNTQQGFEIDEGSSFVTVRNCTARGYLCGYQSKGHSSTKPAEKVSFEDCFAEQCAIGFMASIATNPKDKTGYVGQGVFFNRCHVKDLTEQAKALWVYGADGVFVDNFMIDGNAYIHITEGAGRVSLKNVLFNDEVTTDSLGLIHIDSKVHAGTVSIDNLTSTVAQSLPMIAKTNHNTKLAVRNSLFFGKGENGLYLNRNPRDVFEDNRNMGYTKTIWLSANDIGLPGDCILGAYNKTMLFGNGDVKANQEIKAPLGTKIYYHLNGKTWTQVSANLDEPLWVKDVHNYDATLIIGQENSEYVNHTNVIIHGQAIVTAPAQNANNNRAPTTAWVRGLFEGSIARNGWEKLPNGKIVQWGTFNGARSMQ